MLTCHCMWSMDGSNDCGLLLCSILCSRLVVSFNLKRKMKKDSGNRPSEKEVWREINSEEEPVGQFLCICLLPNFEMHQILQKWETGDIASRICILLINLSCPCHKIASISQSLKQDCLRNEHVSILMNVFAVKHLQTHVVLPQNTSCNLNASCIFRWIIQTHLACSALMDACGHHLCKVKTWGNIFLQKMTKLSFVGNELCINDEAQHGSMVKFCFSNGAAITNEAKWQWKLWQKRCDLHLSERQGIWLGLKCVCHCSHGFLLWRGVAKQFWWTVKQSVAHNCVLWEHPHCCHCFWKWQASLWWTFRAQECTSDLLSESPSHEMEKWLVQFCGSWNQNNIFIASMVGLSHWMLMSQHVQHWC